jgi:elongation factor Ts
MAADAKTVMQLRDRTGAGVMDCKAALEASSGDLEAAVEFLRKKGLADAKKREGRDAKDGVVHAYIHPGSKLGALVEVNCETDFVAKTDAFQGLVRDLAMQVAASNPATSRARTCRPPCSRRSARSTGARWPTRRSRPRCSTRSSRASS